MALREPTLPGMRNALALSVLCFFFQAAALNAADRQLGLAREMLEDAIVRDDGDGMRLARERLLAIAASTEDRTLLCDAHYLVALSAFFESINAFRDANESGRLALLGIHHSDRAIEIDPKFADAWILAGSLRLSAARAGLKVPPAPEGVTDLVQHANELDAKSPNVAFFTGTRRSINPRGAANPDGVKILDDLAARLDADRAATARRFGLWDAEVGAMRIMVRIAADEPDASVLRPMAARLVEQRPDFAFGQLVAASVAERHFVPAPALTWQPFMKDAAGDGKDPKLPDVIAVDRAGTADRLWLRVTFREPLPRSFGTNIAINRSGDPSVGMKWWGTGSTFRFDRLVTAWITRDGDRYFGRVGVTDQDGMRGGRWAKLSSDVQLAMSDDGRSVMVGAPLAVLDLSDNSTFVVAGGSHLVWNDDATSSANSR